MPTDVESKPARGAVLPQPEPDLRAQTIIARAAALRPLLFEQQEENDARGYYSDEIHQALLRGGLYRILQPKMFGGYEFGLETYVRVIMEIAHGHPASGWCFTLAASHGLVLAAHWPEQAQRELFGPDGDFRCAMTAGPAGTFERVAGGYVTSGVHPFASGIPVCTHFMGSGMLRDGGAPRNVYFVVPRSDLTILPDWGGERGMGMQGSGSNSVKLDKVFVPEHYFVPANILLSSEHLPDGTHGTRLHGNPMYLGVLAGWFSCEFGGILTGAARAALDEFERLITTKPMALNPQLTRAHDPHAQLTFGEALSRTDAAEALTLAATRLQVELCERWARERKPITSADTLRVWSISREACRNACEAVEMLFKAAGASVSKRGQRLQRYFRDAQMYRVHIQSQPAFPTMRGQTRLGLLVPPPYGA
ncbi:MAG: acyl-CoA dehydrogenase family protein [Steroidobacteraceae bacterium]